MTAQAFPVDILAVKQYGVARWQREFFWPVSDDAYAALCRDIDTVVREYTSILSEEFADLFLVKRNIFLEYWHFLHALKVLQEIQARGMQPLYSKDSLWYRALLDGIYRASSEGFTSKRSIPQHTAQRWRRQKTDLAMRVRSALYNRSIKKMLCRLHGGTGAKIFGAPAAFERNYMRALPYWISVTSPWYWLSDNAPQPVSGREFQQFEEIARDLVSKVTTVAKKHGIELNEEHETYLARFTSSELQDAAEALTCINIRLRQIGRIDHFFTPIISSPLQRSIAIAVRSRGGQVTSFSHGGNVGLFNSPMLGSSEFALADAFVTYSASSSQLFDYIRRSNPIWGRYPVQKIVSAGDPRYREMQKHWEVKQLPASIKRVMLVGFPYAPWRRPHSGASLALQQLDFELRLVHELAEGGYEVLYKVHPDRRREAEGFFENKVKVIYEPFEHVLDLADAFIFGSIRTTAFPYALCTNKPIVGFLAPRDAQTIMPEARAAMEKRCRLIGTHFDERNCVMFDRDELLQYLSQKPGVSNTEYVDRYLIAHTQ